MLTIKPWQKLLLSLIFSFFLFILVSFGKAAVPIYDYLNLLTTDEITHLNNQIATIGDTYQADVGIVITDHLNNKSPQDYADDFYDTNNYGYGDDYTGLLLLIDMGSRKIYISTSGRCIFAFSDTRISQMVSHIASELQNANYDGACTVFLDDVENTLIKASSSPTTPHASTKPKISLGMVIGICLLIPLLIATLFYVLIKKSYLSPAHSQAPTLPQESSVHYTAKKDNFISTHTTRVRIQNNPPSGGGGGSSTHTSSSGRSHGGGGGSF